MPAEHCEGVMVGRDKSRRKSDALELALFLYDLYKQDTVSGKISNGQNHANTPKDA